MSNCYISEYSAMAIANTWNQVMMMGQEPAVTDQVVTFTGTAGQSAAFNGATKFIRIQTDAICSIAFGANPTATTSNKRVAAGTTEYFGVVPGQKVSIVANT